MDQSISLCIPEQPLSTCNISDLNQNGDPLDRAWCNLEAFAGHSGFDIHDVPHDGDCLYNAVLYQIKPVTLSVAELREMVADYIDSHSDTYMSFISSSVGSNNAYNADCEAPNDEDDYIASISDSHTRSLLNFNKYLRRVRTGAWGDHVIISALSNLFKVTINVIHASEHSCVTASTPPVDSASESEINLGLVMQFHFVGLDKQTTDAAATVAMVTSSADSSIKGVDAPLDDATIEHGDEHTRHITGGPLATMLSVENPEAFTATICLAPAEGQTPLSIMTDPNFETMCNPDKFPYDTGCFNSERSAKLTYRKYFNQRLLDVDGRFAKDHDYLFVAQYIVEAKQILDDANNFIWRQKPGRDFTACQARDQSIMAQCLRKDKAYRFMKNIRGSPPYYQRTLYELLAMIRQLGTPTFFLTLSAADMKWPDVIQTIARQYGTYYSEAQVSALSFEEKSQWIRRNPVTAARHFQYRDFLKSSAKPLGELNDYAIRIEFQARDSPHAHCVLWIKDAPKYGVDDVNDVCHFIDKYITCALPQEEGKLRELVLLLQQHKHSSYCKRIKGCRFHFPHPPSRTTLIAEPCEQPSDSQQVLLKVRNALADDLTLDETLLKADVTPENYVSALHVSNKGSVVVLKREPCESNINNYNASVMLAWQANMDIQFILNPYACVMYVASYMMKTEKAMSELLKQTLHEARTEDLKQQGWVSLSNPQRS